MKEKIMTFILVAGTLIGIVALIIGISTFLQYDTNHGAVMLVILLSVFSISYTDTNLIYQIKSIKPSKK